MPTSIHPSRLFQAYQIFAANTDVGKTIFATGLCRAAALVGASKKSHSLFYVKPVQTGYPKDSDERYVLSKIDIVIHIFICIVNLYYRYFS